MTKIIEVNNVNKSFGKNENINHVLNGASMSVDQGEFVSLMGASGSGKSTLLYLIGGLDRDFQGNISVCGSDIGSLKDSKLSDLRLKNMGFVFQFYNLVMNLNVSDNILLPQTINGKRKSELKKDLDEILEITGLTEKRKAMPNTLSGGQQQRVAIARAVLGNPSIILADEPTGNLDAASTKEIMELFQRLNKEKGMTILQVTHSEQCAEYGTRIVRIEDGKTIG
ncbi:MAG: ABC transporter ATP-binding protein [Clostridiales bacterium]|nr:ABC transporter ATP-binding protein [Clostridiales bacterium]MBQ1294879.1 ABC transporter ATP-binding protein [Clostridiales bacterium]MBQ1572807.1 ABC transporter ATP-binding protein [Clostridiales bacterium]MBQ5768038.1 ABC transporter ATP-binding protein [Clostridiales bacterium]